MKFLRHFFSRRRIRSARRALARNASPQHYAELAGEYARLGMNQEAFEVCREGLHAFPSSAELRTDLERLRSQVREARLAHLKAELTQGPRPALWRETSELYLEAGDLSRAEETAQDWHAKSPSIDSLRTIARVRLKRYFADRGREQGRQALAAIGAVMRSDPRDVEGLRLRLSLTTRLGAWDEARKTTQELLGQLPGDPVLEARFRSLEAMGEGGPTIDRAMLEVESTGLFADESGETGEATADVDVRPLLREVARRAEVQAVMYLKGSTMLVQGPRGATAERQARTVKSIIGCSRTSGRRLGLGQVSQVQLEGDFGTLAIAPGEMDAAALWVEGTMNASLLQTLEGIRGANADTAGEVSP